MVKKILQREFDVLREKAKEVELRNITSPSIKKIVKEMKEALDSQDDGVAIAAPQIGYPLRIFIVSEKVQKIIKGKKTNEESLNDKKELVFINPIIKKLSKEKKVVEEGCLSVRYLYGEVLRSHKATVEAYDQSGKKFTRGGVGLMAQVFQHEIDHLDGILFTDKAKNIEEILPEKIKENVDKK